MAGMASATHRESLVRFCLSDAGLTRGTHQRPILDPCGAFCAVGSVWGELAAHSADRVSGPKYPRSPTCGQWRERRDW
jgi:hypothetical protein